MANYLQSNLNAASQAGNFQSTSSSAGFWDNFEKTAVIADTSDPALNYKPTQSVTLGGTGSGIEQNKVEGDTTQEALAAGASFLKQFVNGQGQQQQVPAQPVQSVAKPLEAGQTKQLPQTTSQLLAQVKQSGGIQ